MSTPHYHHPHLLVRPFVLTPVFHSHRKTAFLLFSVESVDVIDPYCSKKADSSNQRQSSNRTNDERRRRLLAEKLRGKYQEVIVSKILLRSRSPYGRAVYTSCTETILRTPWNVPCLWEVFLWPRCAARCCFVSPVGTVLRDSWELLWYARTLSWLVVVELNSCGSRRSRICGADTVLSKGHRIMYLR